MYEAFFGLKENPFNLNPDPEYIFMSDGHENAHTHLEYAIMESKGFVVLTGEIGAGKTTLLNLFINEIPEDYNVGLINHTFVTPIQFVRKVCREFEVDVNGSDKETMLDAFHEFLLEQYAQNRRVVLIVDEAQNLASKTLEEMRMLSNLESDKSHLIQIILVGQPELKTKLKKKELEQLAQRITVHFHLEALGRQEVHAYILYRLKVGGAKRANIFTDEAMDAIARYSKGIPRMINIICDAALVYAFADSKEFVDVNIINDVIKERAAGGIFLEEPKDSSRAMEQQGGEPHKGGYQNVQISAAELFANEKILRIEDRLSHIEDKLNYFEKGFEELQNQKDRKDAIIIELFKMLHKSIKGRYFVLKGHEIDEKKESSA
jgi:general secretion pathway protein A